MVTRGLAVNGERVPKKRRGQIAGKLIIHTTALTVLCRAGRIGTDPGNGNSVPLTGRIWTSEGTNMMHILNGASPRNSQAGPGPKSPGAKSTGAFPYPPIFENGQAFARPAQSSKRG